MTRWLVALCLSVSLSAFANHVTLIPVYTPQPKFPETLKSAGVAGETRVQFVVHSNGYVSSIKILKSDDPLFSEASSTAVRKWKFKPWEVTNGRPASVEVVAPMIFTYGHGTQLPMDISSILSVLPCTQVNAQVATGNSRQPKTPLHELSFVSYVVRYLSEGVPSVQLSKSRRSALLNEFTQHIPQVIERCAAAPRAYYADQLPDSIRALL
jgi:protein TonB